MALTFKRYFTAAIFFPKEEHWFTLSAKLSKINSNNFQIISNNQVSYLPENHSYKGTSSNQPNPKEWRKRSINLVWFGSSV